MEQWAKINNRYEVSDIGRVRSVDYEWFDSRGRRRFKKGIVLKQAERGDGYLVVNISGFKHKRNWKVHQLVAIHFHGDFSGKMIINHKNGNKKDNRAENLEWCDYSHNNMHAYRVLNREPVKCFGDKNAMSKRVIDTMTGEVYESASEAAKNIGMKRTTLTAMLRGQNLNKTNLRYS